MNFLTHDHALIRGLLVGAVVLASATACSRSDRTETGSNTTGTVTADTSSLGSQGNAGTAPAGDTTTALNADTSSAATPAPAPRVKSAPPRAETGANRDTTTAGYSGMERDTSTAEPVAPRDTARVTTDSAAPTSEQSVTPSDSAPMEVATPTTEDTSGSTPDVTAVPADSSVEMAGAAVQDSVVDSAAGYSEITSDTSTTMAGDTSATPEQTDTTWAAGEVDVAAQENADSAGTNEAAVASPDTTVGVGDSAHVAKTGERLEPVVASAEVNDTLTESEGTPVRPTEDSTDVRETVAAGEARTGDAQANEVGAAAIGGNVSGADAVALMTRQGAQCIVVDPESAQGIVMDMSETPATLNPCGLGSMVFTRIWTKKE